MSQTTDRQPFAFTEREGEPLTIETAVFEALGAASVCWDSMEGTGVFDSERAKEIGDALLAEIHKATGQPDDLLVYQDMGDEWRWLRQAVGNHEKVSASGESFSSRASAVKAAQRANPGLTIRFNR